VINTPSNTNKKGKMHTYYQNHKWKGYIHTDYTDIKKIFKKARSVYQSINSFKKMGKFPIKQLTIIDIKKEINMNNYIY
jgi:hypothetical protein